MQQQTMSKLARQPTKDYASLPVTVGRPEADASEETDLRGLECGSLNSTTEARVSQSQARSSTPQSTACNLLVLMQFAQMTCFTGIILDSYNFCMVAGCSVAFSGLLVGLFQFGGALGNTSMMLVLRCWPSCWRFQMRRILLLCQSLDTVGALAYTALTFYIPRGEHSHTLLLVLAGVRVIWGLGQGLTGQISNVAMAKLTPVANLPNQMQRLQFFQSMGLGCGPVLAAVVIFVSRSAFPEAGAALSFIPNLVLTLMSASVLLCVWATCPSIVEETSLDDPQEAHAVSGDRTVHNRRLVFCCIVLCGMRGYIVSGLEVGTALLLETRYGWTQHWIGLFIGFCFMQSVPLRFCYTKGKDLFPVKYWIRAMLASSVIGACLLFPLFSSALPGGAVLGVADVLVFPCLYLGEGLIRGTMMQYVQGDGAAFDANTVSFLAIVLNNVARLLGPWLCRLTIQDAVDDGQDAYATSQLLCCISFWVLYEIGVAKGTVQHHKKSVAYEEASSIPFEDTSGVCWEGVDLVIGLPSYNEVETIATVAMALDVGCLRYLPGRRCMLLNMDCQSTDGTRDVFKGVHTTCEKHSVCTKEKAEGKGAALRLLFEFMAEKKVPFGMCIDSDLKMMSPEWVQSFGQALIDRQFDMVTPRYQRHRCDGLITNLAVYPTVSAVFGSMIRQPIGGDFGFSLRSVEAFLEKDWPINTRRYGIDIFMTTTVLKKGYTIAEVDLPAKVHAPSLPKLGTMVPEVLATMLWQIASHVPNSKDTWPEPGRVAVIPFHGHRGGIPEMAPEPAALVRLAEAFSSEALTQQSLLQIVDIKEALARGHIDAVTWAKVLAWSIQAIRAATYEECERVAKSLACMFFLRAASHLTLVQPLTNDDAEIEVSLQRDLVIEKCKVQPVTKDDVEIEVSLQRDLVTEK